MPTNGQHFSLLEKLLSPFQLKFKKCKRKFSQHNVYPYKGSPSQMFCTHLKHCTHLYLLHLLYVCLEAQFQDLPPDGLHMLWVLDAHPDQRSFTDANQCFPSDVIL